MNVTLQRRLGNINVTLPSFLRFPAFLLPWPG